VRWAARTDLIGGQRRSGTTLMRTNAGTGTPTLQLVPRESFFFQDKRFEVFFDDLLALA